MTIGGRARRWLVGLAGLAIALPAAIAIDRVLARRPSQTRAGQVRARAAAPPEPPAVTPVAPGASPPRDLRVGTQTLVECARAPLAYCGRLSVPLDRAAAGSGPRIGIAYRWYPATDGRPAAGTVVPVEGGPGLGSINSVRAGYDVMYGPLLSRMNLLAVDNRGTGASTPLSCPALQRFRGSTATSAFQATVAACAAALNHRWRYRDGRWVRASGMFGSVAAAEDLAAVIGALRLGPVDLYGDSYGSFFAQVFASRFPRLVRSLILDSAYPTSGLDPWYAATIRGMPAAFDAVCRRSPACATAARGPSWSRLSALADALRRRPLTGVVPGQRGSLTRVTMNVVGLVDLLNDAAADPGIYREVDAAARALLQDHDPAPLLRLYDQRLYADEDYFGAPAGLYSVELYLAVACVDYPQLFDMSSTPARRAAQLARTEGSLPASTFRPFTTAEWIAQDQNTEAYSACLRWPAPVRSQPPVSRTPRLPVSMPVLVLGGELDTWTPPSVAAHLLARIGGHGRFVELANTTHVVGEGDTACGSELVREFVADPRSVDTLNVSCAGAIPPIHAVGVYAPSLAAQPPLAPSAASGRARPALALAAAAVATAGDAIARYDAIGYTVDHGLHGGTVSANASGTVLALHRDQLVPGVAVSGRVRLSGDAGAGLPQTVVATLTAVAHGVVKGRLTARWPTAGATATVEGAVGALHIAGTTPAP